MGQKIEAVSQLIKQRPLLLRTARLINRPKAISRVLSARKLQSFIERFEGFATTVDSSARLGAVIIETRESPDFGAAVRNHLYFLPQQVGLTVMHGSINGDYVRAQLSGVDGVQFVNLDVAEVDVRWVNELICTPAFWQRFTYDKVLMFQPDSLLLRRGISEFLEYDYIGAPWSFYPVAGGNGGLSIRSRDLMLKICEKYPNALQNEDHFFAWHAPEFGARLATPEVARRFSVETIFYERPIGMHAAWRYLPGRQVRSIIDLASKELDASR